jgi:hypothetical protein
MVTTFNKKFTSHASNSSISSFFHYSFELPFNNF